MQSRAGFTLIEVMVALLISLVGLLGLLQSINVATEHNIRNQLRDEAVLVAEKYMGNLKVRAFDQISGINSAQFSPRTINSQLRGGNTVYTVERPCTSTGTGGTTATLTVKVTWAYKGAQYSHAVTSIRSD